MKKGRVAENKTKQAARDQIRKRTLILIQGVSESHGRLESREEARSKLLFERIYLIFSREELAGYWLVQERNVGLD